MISVSNLTKPPINHVLNAFHAKAAAAAKFGVYTVASNVPDLPITGAYGFDKPLPIPQPLPDGTTLFLRGDAPLSNGLTVGQAYTLLTRRAGDRIDISFDRNYTGVCTTAFNDVTDSSSDVYSLAWPVSATTYCRILDSSAAFTRFRGTDIDTPGRPGAVIRYYSPTLAALSPSGADFSAPYDIIRVSVYFSIYTDTSGTTATLTYLTAAKRTGSVCLMGTLNPVNFFTDLYGVYIELYYKA